MQKAHEAGVIHRDLKPSNVMLTMDDEADRYGFWIGPRLKSGETELTATGLMLGSPSYMSPEQVEARHQEVGPWTDVWALGVMLFEMLTGHRPFKGSSTAAVLGRIIEGEPQRFSQLQCSAAPALETICLKALAKEIKKRYQSAREFADELVRFTADATAPPPAGAKLPDTAGEPESPSASSRHRRRGAELRQVTIAVFNFELGSGTGDVEAQNEIAQTFRQFVAERVRRFNGALMASSGQEVLACFGFPVAYEDSTQRHSLRPIGG